METHTRTCRIGSFTFEHKKKRWQFKSIPYLPHGDEEDKMWEAIINSGLWTRIVKDFSECFAVTKPKLFISKSLHIPKWLDSPSEENVFGISGYTMNFVTGRPQLCIKMQENPNNYPAFMVDVVACREVKGNYYFILKPQQRLVDDYLEIVVENVKNIYPADLRHKYLELMSQINWFDVKRNKVFMAETSHSRIKYRVAKVTYEDAGNPIELHCETIYPKKWTGKKRAASNLAVLKVRDVDWFNRGTRECGFTVDLIDNDVDTSLRFYTYRKTSAGYKKLFQFMNNKLDGKKWQHAVSQPDDHTLITIQGFNTGFNPFCVRATFCRWINFAYSRDGRSTRKIFDEELQLFVDKVKILDKGKKCRLYLLGSMSVNSLYKRDYSTVTYEELQRQKEDKHTYGGWTCPEYLDFEIKSLSEINGPLS